MEKSRYSLDLECHNVLIKGSMNFVIIIITRWLEQSNT